MNFLKIKKHIAFILLFVATIIGTSYYYPIYKENLKWKQYFKRTNIGDPNNLVSSYFKSATYVNPADIKILDLGAGNGSDSLYLLNKGYEIYAVDFQNESIERIKSNMAPEKNKNIKLINSDFQHLDWNNLPKFDVIIAINSISFIKNEDFYKLWHKISTQLKPNGIIIARLFGDKLDWPNMQNMTLLNKAQLNHLTENFKVIKIEEEFYTEDRLKQHAFDLVLRKT